MMGKKLFIRVVWLAVVDIKLKHVFALVQRIALNFVVKEVCHQGQEMLGCFIFWNRTTLVEQDRHIKSRRKHI